MPHHVASRTLRHLGIAALALALTLLVPAASVAQSAVQGTFDRTLTVSGPADLDLTTGSGDVFVRSGPAGSVHVVGRIRASQSWFGSGGAAADKVKALEAKPPIEQTGNAIRIGRIEDKDLQQNVSISYEITVPSQCKLRSHTGSGDQKIGDISGPVDVASGSGDLVLGAIGGRVDATAGSGDITVGGAQGGLGVRTGSGDIQVKDVTGDFTASSGSGDINVSGSVSGAVRANAASGDVTIRGVKGALRVDSASGDIVVQGTPTGEWELSSASGSITLELPQTASFDLDVRTSSGRIDSKHPVTMTGSADRHSLAGKVRNGGPLIRMHTSSGNVEIR